MDKKTKNIVSVAILIAVGVIVRICLALNMKSMDGDTAVFGLMAKHIFEGKVMKVKKIAK